MSRISIISGVGDASPFVGDPHSVADVGAPSAALGIRSAVSDVYLEQRGRLERRPPRTRVSQDDMPPERL